MDDEFIICKGEGEKLISIKREDRVHMAIFGMPGSGKSTFMLFQIYQHIEKGDGICVIDPHGDLIKKTLSIIPKEKWNNVVYIDPITAFKYGRVIKIALLECKDPLKKPLIAMGFVDSMKKLYGEFWGPRLERILLNAIYAVMDQPDSRLSYLYDMLIDSRKRDKLLSNVKDEKVIKYWMNEFPLLKDEAPTVVTNKVYRLVQEKLLAPMFDCSKSSINFRECMDAGKIILINLSEGNLTTEVANFLGALILNKIYQEGMTREEIPEESRKPFYVYVDEAYRFVTDSIKDMLQALRKYKIYITLAAQYLSQFDREGGKDKTLTKAIPQLCDAIISFSVGGETAEELEQYFKPIFRYITRDTLMTLMRHQMAFSIRRGNERYVNTGMCIDISNKKISKPDEVIKHSLSIYGKQIFMEVNDSIPSPDISPICFSILSFIYYRREPTPINVIENELKHFFKREIRNAINELLYDGMIYISGKELALTATSYYKFKEFPMGDFITIQAIGSFVRRERMKGCYCIVNTMKPYVIVYPPRYLNEGRIDPYVWDYSNRYIAYFCSYGKKPKLNYNIPIKLIVPSELENSSLKITSFEKPRPSYSDRSCLPSRNQQAQTHL
ncbi:MAG: type IV secretion system DNA-binding domain-containing protein [Candidatus Methanomethyliaceae archaeon]|nr:type IV secretion system DNA-binding domain-containing protein [Candidatus Methanomethyliaceae archaeon]MDW7971321.1 type IV secretion system DNA-binding domain-containing protein [Nitrososphaerota archaeon]